MNKLVVLFIFSLYAAPLYAQNNKPIDAKATKETKALFYNLKHLSKKHTLFGHQHATEYGHGWSGDPDRSDENQLQVLTQQ